MGLEQRLTALWQGPRPTWAANALRPLSWLYGGLAALHPWLYTKGWRQVAHAPRPLIVVGNLVAGGAGKTPTVMAIIELLRGMGHQPGVLSRGHGRRGSGLIDVTRSASADAVGDEPLLIHLRSGAPVMVGADRAAAAQALCRAHPELTVLVADDGLQHHRLARDIEVLVFDDRGIGNGLRLPAGPLRQGLPTALTATQLVLYTGGRRSTPLPGHLGRRSVTGVVPLADWWAGHAADRSAKESGDGFAAVRGRPLLAAAGLAQPQAFFAMLQAEGLQVQPLPLPDHARFDPLPWPADTADVVLTEKDAVKLRPEAVGSTRVWVAPLDFRPDAGFAGALRALCERLAPTRAPSRRLPR